MNDLVWLQAWFQDHCDGDWEHGYGVRIDTLDNPGWRIRVEVAGTDLEERQVPALDFQRTEDDWLQMSRGGGSVELHCGPGNLVEAIALFRRWVEKPEDLPSPGKPASPHIIE